MGVHRHFYCPNCGAHLDYKLGYGHSSVGSPNAQCPKCGTHYATGKSEWADKKGPQKIAYFLSSPLRLVANVLQGAFIAFLLTALITEVAFDGMSQCLLMFGAALGAVLGLWAWWRELQDDLAPRQKDKVGGP